MVDLDLLAEKVDRMNETINFLQDYITIKFGLDFQEFCKRKEIREEGRRSFRRIEKLSMEEEEVIISSMPSPGQIVHVHPVESEDDKELTKNFFCDVKIERMDEEGEEEVVGSFQNQDDSASVLMMGSVISGRGDAGDDVDKSQGKDTFYESDSGSSSWSLCNGLGRRRPRAQKKKKSLKVRPVALQSKVPGDPLRHIRYDITYVLSLAGMEKLIYKSYAFILHREYPSGRKYWVCACRRTFKCKSRIMQEPDGTPSLSDADHCHPPPPPAPPVDPNKIKRARTKKKSLSKSNESKKNMTVANTE